jgi:hypothetical protein
MELTKINSGLNNVSYGAWSDCTEFSDRHRPGSVLVIKTPELNNTRVKTSIKTTHLTKFKYLLSNYFIQNGKSMTYYDKKKLMEQKHMQNLHVLIISKKMCQILKKIILL